MTIRNGNHCYAYRCACGEAKAGYPSRDAAARAERRHRGHYPGGHVKAPAGRDGAR